MVWFGLCWRSKVYTMEVDRREKSVEQSTNPILNPSARLENTFFVNCPVVGHCTDKHQAYAHASYDPLIMMASPITHYYEFLWVFVFLLYFFIYLWVGVWSLFCTSIPSVIRSSFSAQYWICICIVSCNQFGLKIYFILLCIYVCIHIIFLIDSRKNNA